MYDCWSMIGICVRNLQADRQFKFQCDVVQVGLCYLADIKLIDGGKIESQNQETGPTVRAGIGNL